MDNKNTKRKRLGGRAVRKAERSDIHNQINPCTPGQLGGQYTPLSSDDVKKIYTASLKILAEIGMSQVPELLQQKAIDTGAFLNKNSRLCFPTSLVEDIIDKAAKRFTFFARDKQHDFEVGGEKVYFGTGGAAVQTLDLHTGLYRPSTLKDLHDFTRLVDTLTNISWFTRCCVATDVTDNFELDINTAYALINGTTKPIGTSFFLGEHVAPVVEMFDMALGGQGKFAARPFCKAHISPIISPLRFGEDALAVTLECIKHNMPINAIIAAQSGATAPATLAGMLAQTTAETLAALIMVNLFSPGYPMIFSNWPLVIDLRSGSFVGGGGEIALLNAASGQIGNWLGLPTGCAASMADAKAVDAQMGSEKAITALSAGLAGCNMVYESSGMMASLLGVSFEAFILDNEMLSHVYRTIRGIEVNDETLGLQTIEKVVNGEGHFLGSMHTMAAMQRDYYYPDLADRNDPRTWNDEGAVDIWSKAKDKAKEILNTHNPTYINKKLDQKIKDTFNIIEY